MRKLIEICTKMSAEYLYCFENTILARQCKLFLDYVFIPKDKGSYTEKLYHVVNVQTNSRSYEHCQSRHVHRTMILWTKWRRLTLIIVTWKEVKVRWLLSSRSFTIQIYHRLYTVGLLLNINMKMTQSQKLNLDFNKSIYNENEGKVNCQMPHRHFRPSESSYS